MYVEGNLQDDIVKYSRNFEVLISLPESRRFVYNHQCTTTQMALPLNNLFLFDSFLGWVVYYRISCGHFKCAQVLDYQV